MTEGFDPRVSLKIAELRFPPFIIMDMFSTFPRHELACALRELADRGVSIGTSSWKYPGWCGLLYDEQRYFYRGRFAKSRFERDCLTEYAEVFPTVCVDAGYYAFPKPAQIESLCSQVPADFRFSYKVTEEITVKRFSHLPRYGNRRGIENPNFLSASSFALNFLRPLEPHRDQIGLLMFEFSRFKKADFESGREFLGQLDRFLGDLPTGWQYGVEIRNESFLRPEYFEVLARHGVTHVYNSWQRMPGIADQMKIDGSRTAPFFGSRLLLKPGRKYADAVGAFEPYEKIHETQPDIRAAAIDLIGSELKQDRSLKVAETPSVQAEGSYLYVNNRLEGNSLFTIIGILAGLGMMSKVEGME